MRKCRRAHCAWILSLALITLPASLLEAGSWSTFRGPRGSGEAIDPLPPGEGALALDLAWKRPLGSGYSGISVADRSLVTAFTDGEADLVMALDVATGEELWRYRLGPSYQGQDGSHDGPIATPTIADGRVFALDPSGLLVGLDLASGAELWTAHLVDDLGSERPYYGFAGSPMVSDDVLVLQVGGSEGAVAGFDVASGELRWRSLADGVDAQSPILAEIAGHLQVLVLGEEKLAGLDPATGAVLWELEHEGEGPMAAMTQSPVPLGDDRIFVKYDKPSAAVFELGDENGQMTVRRLVTSRGLTRSYSPATVAGRYVYGFTGRILSSVDPTNGELLWRTRDVGDGFVISVGDQLAILEKTGTLHLGPASPDGWSGSASLHLFDDLAWTPPSYAGGSFYARSLGEIARVDLVRTVEPVSIVADEAPRLPAALSELAAAVAEASDPGAVVDRFLDGRTLPLVDDRSVVFLWRGPAEDVAVAGDMIGMRREEPMHRLEGADLWWWETQIDPRARLSYLFYVDLEPTVDPAHDRVATTTILGPDMNWQRDEAVEMSWFAMPEWPGLGLETEVVAAGGRLEEIEIEIQPSAPEGEETPEPVQVPTAVWLPSSYEGSDDAYPVVYVLHPGARERGEWIETLDRVVGRSVEPLIVVFPEFPRVPGLGGTLAGQLVPRIDEMFHTRSQRDGRAVVGMGFPGYTAARLAFTHAETFGALGLQSIFLTEGGMEEGLRGSIGEQTAETTPMRIYMEWGRWDLVSPHEQMDFRAASRWTWELFRDLGYEPIGGEVWDSTDFASWSNRTDVLLEALFPAEGAGGDDGLAIWLTGRP